MKDKLSQLLTLLLLACMALSHAVHLSAKLPFFTDLQALIRWLLELSVIIISFTCSFLAYRKLRSRLIFGIVFFTVSRFCGLFLVNGISALIWKSSLLEAPLEASGRIAFVFIDNWTRNMYYYEYFFSGLVVYVLHLYVINFRQQKTT